MHQINSHQPSIPSSLCKAGGGGRNRPECVRLRALQNFYKYNVRLPSHKCESALKQNAICTGVNTLLHQAKEEKGSVQHI